MKITDTRKEDELYYQGPFWIIGDSVKELHRGHFQIVGSKFACYYNGEYIKDDRSKSKRTHKKIWDSEYSQSYNDAGFDFYPRGRVAIYDGTAFIHLNSRCNIPSVIDAIIREYSIPKLDIEIEFSNTYQGSHYDFQLK